MENRKKVILADANEEFRYLIQKTIEASGAFEVVASTGDGAQVLPQVEQLRPDLLLMEMVLPGVEGFGILKQLEDAAQYGMVLRAKGYVASNDSDRWIHFDYVPGESDVREGGAMVTGRVCVIGSKLNESAIDSLFGA